MDRPSRSQHNLLEYIEQFVAQHGYGPSYREIMKALDYKSVSTVAIHINGLIAKGQLKKHGRSARSLEVVKIGEKAANRDNNDPEAWITAKIEMFMQKSQNAEDVVTIARAMKLLDLNKAHAAAERRAKDNLA